MKTGKPLPQFFKTLKPNSNSNSISPQFNANSSHKLPLHSPNPNPNPNPNASPTRKAHHNHDQVSNFIIRQVSDSNKFHPSSETLIQGSPKIPLKCISTGTNMLRVDEGIDRSITQKKIPDVIELNDDDFVDYIYDDDDCVFVRKEKNLLPRGINKNDPIFVDGYVKEIKSENKVSIHLDKVVHCVDDNDEVKIVDVRPSFKKKKTSFPGILIVELGESSGSKTRMINDDEIILIDDSVMEKEATFLCDICADSKPKKESFTIKGCSHSYCSDCITNYVASKLQDGVSQVRCPVPDCGGVLEPEYCRDILPFEVFVRWGNLLCESVILASQKFYCPFKDCSALLIDDGGDNVTQAECPSCFRLFCAQCKVGWHNGIDCAEFQKLGKDERQKEDLMLRDLAKNQKWQRCPACKFYVEKSQGCLYMKCRCGVAFCYSCGAVNTDHRYHYCKNCGR